jgi:hypothetical protein
MPFGLAGPLPLKDKVGEIRVKNISIYYTTNKRIKSIKKYNCRAIDFSPFLYDS